MDFFGLRSSSPRYNLEIASDIAVNGGAKSYTWLQHGRELRYNHGNIFLPNIPRISSIDRDYGACNRIHDNPWSLALSPKRGIEEHETIHGHTVTNIHARITVSCKANVVR